jgi:hypothetical protein
VYIFDVPREDGCALPRASDRLPLTHEPRLLATASACSATRSAEDALWSAWLAGVSDAGAVGSPLFQSPHPRAPVQSPSPEQLKALLSRIRVNAEVVCE